MRWRKFFSFLLNSKFPQDDTIHKIFASSAILALIICVIPSLVFDKQDILVSRYDHNRETNLQKSLHSLLFYTSIVSSLAFSVPISSDLCLDWYFSTRPSNIIFISMWALALGILIPNLIMLFGVYGTERIQYVSSLNSISYIVVILSSTSLLCIYGGKIWKCISLVISVIFYLGFVIAISYSPFLGKDSQFFIDHTLKYVLFGFTSMFFAIPLLRWIIHLRSLGLASISRDDVACSTVVAALLSVTLGCWLLLYFYATSVYVERKAEYFAYFNYLITGFAFVVIVLTGRIYRYEMSRLHERHAKELDQKRSFVRYVSHEIRTPLNIIQMGLQLMRRELWPGSEGGAEERIQRCADVLGDIETSCSTAVDILNELLDYEKLESGLLRIEPKLFPLAQFVYECTSAYRLQAREKDILLTVAFLRGSVSQFSQCEVGDGDGGLGGRGAYVLSPEVLEGILVRADPRKLSQVMRNLLSNAIKFTPRSGKVAVEVFVVDKNSAVDTRTLPRKTRVPLLSSSSSSAPIVPDGLSTLVVTVSDTGAGISKENQSRLFKEIVQFEPGKLQEGKGSGVGLWISGRIVDLHEGCISVYSEGAGRGTTFKMQLPKSLAVRLESSSSHDIRLQCDISRKLSDQKDGERKGAEETPAGEVNSFAKSRISEVLRAEAYVAADNFERSRLHSMNRSPSDVMQFNPKRLDRLRVLVVDDSVSNRKMLARLLRDDCSEVHMAEDGAVAVAKVGESLASSEAYDVVLMDFQMPNMDGPTATKRIRELGFTGLILGVTGNALPADIELFLSQGANRVLSKPVKFDLLTNTILELI